MNDGLREVIRQIDSICIASYSLRAEHFLSSTHRVRIKLTDFLFTFMKSGDKEESRKYFGSNLDRKRSNAQATFLMLMHPVWS
jgi:hypothetical protein